VLAIVLIQGLDDWVPIDSAYNAVHYVTGSSRGARLVVRRVLHQLLDNGLAVVGEVRAGFQRWPGTTAEHLRRIDEFINENPDDLDTSFEFWFQLTPKGKDLAITVPDPYADDPDW